MQKSHALAATLQQREQALIEALATRDQAKVLAASQLRDLIARQLQREIEREAVHAAKLEVRRAIERQAPPDLQALVAQHGTWEQITPQAWDQFDADMARWREQMRGGAFRQTVSKAKYADRE